MDSKILEDCDRLALEGKMTFPESVARMAAIGVERYRADLVRMVKTHYVADGENYSVNMSLAAAPSVAMEFDSGGVQAALGAIQTARIDYGEFLRRILTAGVAEYGVWLRGRVAIYTGRAGEFYVEKFPDTL